MKARTERHTAAGTYPGAVTAIEITLPLGKAAAETIALPTPRATEYAEAPAMTPVQANAGPAAQRAHTPAAEMIVVGNAGDAPTTVDRAVPGIAARQTPIVLPRTIVLMLQKSRKISPRRTSSPRFVAIYAL